MQERKNEPPLTATGRSRNWPSQYAEDLKANFRDNQALFLPDLVRFAGRAGIFAPRSF
jgi:hypothetical protein